MRNEHYILVVDDNCDAADTMAYLLELSGWNAAAVYGGPEAIQAVNENKPKVLLLDIGMPGMSGLEVAQRLSAQFGASCPTLVALTAWADAAMRARTLALGFAAHVAKPAEIGFINTLLESLLSSTDHTYIAPFRDSAQLLTLLCRQSGSNLQRRDIAGRQFLYMASRQAKVFIAMRIVPRVVPMPHYIRNTCLTDLRRRIPGRRIAQGLPSFRALMSRHLRKLRIAPPSNFPDWSLRESLVCLALRRKRRHPPASSLVAAALQGLCGLTFSTHPLLREIELPKYHVSLEFLSAS